MSMFAASLTVLTSGLAIAAVRSAAVLTSVTAPLAAGVSPSPLNAVKAAFGWGSDTFPSGWGSDTSPSGWGSDTSFSGWGSDTSFSGWGSDTSPFGWAHCAQFSGKASSAPQTGQSVFMLSAVQAVSQLHGGVSVLSSAKAAVGIRHSSIHRASRVLNMRFFILHPPFRRLLTA